MANPPSRSARTTIPANRHGPTTTPALARTISGPPRRTSAPRHSANPVARYSGSPPTAASRLELGRIPALTAPGCSSPVTPAAAPNGFWKASSPRTSGRSNPAIPSAARSSCIKRAGAAGRRRLTRSDGCLWARHECQPPRSARAGNGARSTKISLFVDSSVMPTTLLRFVGGSVVR